MNETTFRALKGDKTIAKARDLRELADKLRKLGVNARQVEIKSTLSVKPRRRFGLRYDRYNY